MARGLKNADVWSLFPSRSQIPQLVNPDYRLAPVMRSWRSQADFKQLGEQLQASVIQFRQPPPYLLVFDLGRIIGKFANISSFSLCRGSFPSDEIPESSNQAYLFQVLRFENLLEAHSGFRPTRIPVSSSIRLTSRHLSYTRPPSTLVNFLGADDESKMRHTRSKAQVAPFVTTSKIAKKTGHLY